MGIIIPMNHIVKLNDTMYLNCLAALDVFLSKAGENSVYHGLNKKSMYWLVTITNFRR